MSIERLMKVVPPPAEPFEAFDGPWERIEAGLGTALPQDYKDFVRVYGSGYFMEFLGVDVPKSRNPNVRLERQVGVVRDMFRAFEEVPYPLWPDPGGLLPFGGTDNGDTLFWLADGAPADWRVVVSDRGAWDFEALDCGLTDFLAGLATGEILPRAFPEDLLPCERLFEPNLPATSAPQAVIRLHWRLGSFGGLSGSSVCRLR
jgi:hypothetical protein